MPGRIRTAVTGTGKLDKKVSAIEGCPATFAIEATVEWFVYNEGFGETFVYGELV